MRVVAGVAIFTHSFERLRTGPPIGPSIAEVARLATGILLLAGLWTPVSGSLVAAFGIWGAVQEPGDPWANILLGTIGAGLGLLGPGAWSIDARLFGWRRIDVHDQER
jgi:putative oxidoreductase